MRANLVLVTFLFKAIGRRPYAVNFYKCFAVVINKYIMKLVHWLTDNPSKTPRDGLCTCINYFSLYLLLSS